MELALVGASVLSRVGARGLTLVGASRAASFLATSCPLARRKFCDHKRLECRVRGNSHRVRRVHRHVACPQPAIIRNSSCGSSPMKSARGLQAHEATAIRARFQGARPSRRCHQLCMPEYCRGMLIRQLFKRLFPGLGGFIAYLRRTPDRRRKTGSQKTSPCENQHRRTDTRQRNRTDKRKRDRTDTRQNDRTD